MRVGKMGAALGLALAWMTLIMAVPDREDTAVIQGRDYPVYPQTMAQSAGLPSPCTSDDGREFLTACTRDGHWALVDATVPDWRRETVKYFGDNVLAVDKADFPSLARLGLHDEAELSRTRTINGRPLAEINEQARPGRLSTAGFLAANEDVLSVLLADNRRVRKMGFTHPLLARPLLHMWNLILQEQAHRRGEWSRGHAWKHFGFFLYNGKKISYEAHFTKGGQLSPFGDGIEGAVHVFLEREPEPAEKALLDRRYRHLGAEKREALDRRLFSMATGEMQPFYIVRYGFYEGHTMWRVDPIAIASIFGLRPIADLDTDFAGTLGDALLAPHAAVR